MKPDAVKISVNGKIVVDNILNEDCPSSILYIENSDFAKELAQGLTEEENLIEVQKRTADACFETWIETLVELSGLDKTAPETWCSERNLPYSLVMAIIAETFKTDSTRAPDPGLDGTSAAEDLLDLARAQLEI